MKTIPIRTFYLQHLNVKLFRLLHNFFRPEGTLHLADMRFAQEEHTDPGLADTAADGVGKLFIKDRFLEREFGTVRTPCFFQTYLQAPGW